MAQIMEVIMRLSRGKGVVDDASSVNTIARTQGVTEGSVYNPYNHVGHTTPKVGTPYCPIPPIMNTLSKTCLPLPPALIPSGWVYTYPYIPPLIVPIPPVA